MNLNVLFAKLQHHYIKYMKINLSYFLDLLVNNRLQLGYLFLTME